MNRRAFLRLMGLSSAGVFAGVLDPDLLTWQPGAKVYSLPPVEVFDALTPDWITREAIQIFKNNLALATRINREYDASFRVGRTIRVPLVTLKEKPSWT